MCACICVRACMCAPYLWLSFHSELNMHLHVQWEQMTYQEHFVGAANGDNSGKSLSQTVVDHFRWRRINSSCRHAYISAGTASPSCATCLRIRYITQTSPPLGPAQSTLSHSLFLSLSLCASFTPRQFLLVSSALNLAPFEPSLSEKL